MNNLKVTLIAFLGSLLWVIHFMSIYAFAEFGCQSNWKGTSEVIMGITLLCFFLGLYSIYKSYKVSQLISKEAQSALFFLARYGIINNAVFTFIIIYQSVPVFYFRGECL